MIEASGKSIARLSTPLLVIVMSFAQATPGPVIHAGEPSLGAAAERRLWDCVAVGTQRGGLSLPLPAVSSRNNLRPDVTLQFGIALQASRHGPQPAPCGF